MTVAPERAERLPPPAPIRAIASATGPVLLRPWFDRVTLRWLAQWYFPLSRGWAAALAAGGSPDGLQTSLGVGDLPQGLVRHLLDLVQRRHDAYAREAVAWEAAFFGDAEPAAAGLVRAERSRQRAAHDLMAARTAVFPLRLRRHLPPVAYDPPTPEQMEARHGARLEGREPAFPPPPAAAIDQSRRVAGGYGEISWLRWPSPSGDTAWARVYTPFADADPPTLIFLHGIAMEPEMWREVADPVNALAAWAGVRVVRPEGPWHGRRRRPGFYGGEPILAHAPEGLVDLMQTWVAETGQLVHWARETSRGPVALGGLSLGALTVQVAATAARAWPAELHPDAMFLSVTSRDMTGVGYEGALARSLGLPEALSARGWDKAGLERWLPLLEPQGPPAVAPQRIVVLLGRNDTVTPYEGGRELVREWGVPRGNLYVWPKGHFTAPLGLYRDDEPLKRLVALLRGAEPGPA